MTTRRYFVKLVGAMAASGAIPRIAAAQGAKPDRPKKEQAMSIEAARNAVTAIDILLEPDATMLQRAQVVNDRVLKAFPNG